MEGPVAFLVGEKLDLPHLPDRDVLGDLVAARTLRRRAAIGAGNEELVAVQVHRVVGHRQVAHADADLVVLPDDQRIDAGKDAAVPGPQVEVEHRHDLRRVAAGIDVVGREQETEVAVDLVDQRMLVLRMGDPETHHAHRHLHHLVGVRVVHEGAGAARHELVDEGLARRNARLRQAGDAVHAVGQPLAVPVDAVQFAQLVGDEDANPIAFDHFDRRPRALAVVAPQMRFEALGHLAHDRFGDEMELLDAVVHAPRQSPAVQRDHGVVGPAAVRHQRRHGVGPGLDHGFRQGGHRHLADRRGRDGRRDGACAAEETASGNHVVSFAGQWAAPPGSAATAGPAGTARLGLPISAMSRSACAIQKSRSESM